MGDVRLEQSGEELVKLSLAQIQSGPKCQKAALDSARQANVRLTKYYLRVKMIFLAA